MMKYNILDYGAQVSDALQTEPIQRAIDACFLAGGGEVHVPAGIFRVGCIRLRSNVTLYLETGAILEGSDCPEDYLSYLEDRVEPIELPDAAGVQRSNDPYSRWNNAIIRALFAQNIAIIGEKGSYIDGVNCFDPQGEEDYRGPHAINMHGCQGIRLSGYTIRNSANWAHAIFKSSGIDVRNVTVYGGHDGLDIRTCDDVLIEDCVFSTGDDCIAGYDNNDVVIRRCWMDSSCSALRFGGNHVLVEDCQMVAPGRFGFRGQLARSRKETSRMADETCRHNMHQAVQYYCDFRADPRRTPGDILLRRCRFVNADRLMELPYDGKHIWCCNRPLSSIRFEDCVAEGLSEPTWIYGGAEEPLTLELERVELHARKGCEQQALIEARNHALISLKQVKIHGYADPHIIVHTDGAVCTVETTPIRIEKAEE